VSRSERATCERSQRGSPSATSSATSVTVMLPSWLSSLMRGHHDKTLHRPLLSGCLHPRRNPLQLCEGVIRQPQVCDHCGGRFGMVTHRWWGNKSARGRANTRTSVNLRSTEIESVAGTASLRGGIVSNFSPPHARTVPCKTSFSARPRSGLWFRRPIMRSFGRHPVRELDRTRQTRRGAAGTVNRNARRRIRHGVHQSRQ
jgi:hypothetical protein